MSPASWRC
ncbi:hypothetical protein E2C01_041035 [Portunus trituberculatus]|uniref:Uncharacterized protein n=1 Tax=Portunus trituberculatus TaxID=210409 RepID=A0A5B7FQD0_PORTR|nr:hypothetical protein [Portunus trituberculatus]